MEVSTTLNLQTNLVPIACPHCSGQFNSVYHTGPCPRVKAIEYHPNGCVKRIEFWEP